MPYLKCPSCSQLAHVSTDHVAAIHCPRCRALQKDVRLLPLDEAADAEAGSPPSRSPARLLSASAQPGEL
jgi:phage FluMu protein Com